MVGVRADAQQQQWWWVQKQHDCFRLLVDSCTFRNLWMKTLGEKNFMSKACMHQKEVAQNPGFKTLGERNLIQFLADMKLQFVRPCQYEIHISL